MDRTVSLGRAGVFLVGPVVTFLTRGAPVRMDRLRIKADAGLQVSFFVFETLCIPISRSLLFSSEEWLL
jgi:hypothetical protein